MKKIIAISALLTSLLAIAGPKADLQTANKLLAEKKVDQAVKVLKDSKNVKGEEAEYELINYELATKFAKSNEEAIEYLKKAAENPKSNSQAAVQANIYLANSAKTNKEKIKYLEMLNERFNKSDLDTLSVLAALYKVENETSKFNDIVKLIENTKRQDVIDNFNLLLGRALLGTNKESEGISYLNKAANSKFVNIKSGVYLAYADYYVVKKDAKNVIKYLNAASIDKENYRLISDRFLNVLGDVKTAYSYAEKAYNNSPAVNEYLQYVFVLSTITKDSKGEAKYANLLKKKGAKNITLAVLLHNNGINESAEKYAKLALKDKSKEADFLLSLIYGNTGKIDLAITHAKKAVANKVTGADNVLKQLEAIKKQAK